MASQPFLLVRAGAWLCALPLGSVLETMRVLPHRKLLGVPSYVLGVGSIRGEPTPIVALGALLEGGVAEPCTRLVTVRSAQGRVALGVAAVVGVRQLGRESSAPWVGVLSQLPSYHVESLTHLDGELLAVLSTANLVPEELAQALLAEGR
ncbi:MAG: chemotaxis protein CheW [Myxococcales bacterium]